MTDPFDDLIEKTREKYRVSWEKSLEKFKKFCAIQDEEFEWAIKHGKFYPKITLERVVVEAKPRKLRAEYSLEIIPDKFKVVCDETNNSPKDAEEGRINVDIYLYPHKNLYEITIHPEVYEFLENYKKYTPIQRFLWNLKWGFKDCRDNFRNWQGHMKGEDWNFWDILSGEWSAYE